MAGLFSGLFKKKSSSFLGIDIGSSAIKVVQLRKSGSQAILETYGELALGPYAGAEIGQATALPTDKIIEALTDLMKEKEVNLTTNVCGVAIPFSSSLLSVMEMPLLSYKQLSSMVPLEARKYIPVPISEVTLDWTIIPREDSQPEVEEEAGNEVSKIKLTDILMIAIHNDTISKYQEIVEKSGLKSNFFEVEIFSSMRSVLDQTSEPIMLFDMGSASTKLYIVERGIVRMSHTINRGSQDITSVISKSLGIPIKEAEIMKRGLGANNSSTTDIKEMVRLSLDYIFSESNQVILNFQKKYNKVLKRIVLIGGGSSLKGFAPIAQENFQVEVVAGNPFGKTEAPAFLEEVLKSTGPEFAVAVGLALRGIQEH